MYCCLLSVGRNFGSFSFLNTSVISEMSETLVLDELKVFREDQACDYIIDYSR
jgi:hypothetical protein